MKWNATDIQMLITDLDFETRNTGIATLDHALWMIKSHIQQTGGRLLNNYYADLLDGNTELARTHTAIATALGQHVFSHQYKPLMRNYDEVAINRENLHSEIKPLLEQFQVQRMIARQVIDTKGVQVDLPPALQYAHELQSPLFRTDVSFSLWLMNDYLSWNRTVTYLPTDEIIPFKNNGSEGPYAETGVMYIKSNLRHILPPVTYQVDWDALLIALYGTDNEITLSTDLLGAAEPQVVQLTATAEYTDGYEGSWIETDQLRVKVHDTDHRQVVNFAMGFKEDEVPLWVKVLLAMHLELSYQTT